MSLMLRTVLCVVILATAWVRPATAWADTTVSGTLPASARWTLAGSPYLVTRSVFVPPGLTLTIDPGVEVHFSSRQSLRIDGALIARGTAAQRIRFAPAPGPAGQEWWSGIVFGNSSADAVLDAGDQWSSGSVLSQAIVEGTGEPNRSGSTAVTLDRARPLIEDVSIRQATGNGIVASFDQATFVGALVIRHCDIEGIPAGAGSLPLGISVSNLGVVRIENNVVRNFRLTAISVRPNTPLTAAVVADIRVVGNTATGSGQGLSATLWGNASFLIAGNTFTGNGAGADVGISSYIAGGTSLVFTRNRVHASTEYGVSLRGWTQTGANQFSVTDNLITDNASGSTAGLYRGHASGLFVENRGTSTITQNVISGNSLSDFSGAAGVGLIADGPMTFSRNLVAGNIGYRTSGVWLQARGASAVEANDNTIVQNTATNVPQYADWPPPSAIEVSIYPWESPTVRFRGNNIVANRTPLPVDRFALKAYGPASPALDFTGNWWGSSDPAAIQAGVYLYEDTAVDTGGALPGPNLNAPLSPPTGVVALHGASTTTVTWRLNPEPDVVGYRVWYGAPGDATLRGTGASEGPSPIDVGSTTSTQLTGLPADTVFRVSAYDADRDGVDDQTEGHESWFEPLPRAPLTVTLTTYPELPRPSSAYLNVFASATGGYPDYEYKFFLWDGAEWTVLRDWSVHESYGTQPSGPNMNYRVAVWARSFTNRRNEADGPTAVATLDVPLYPQLSATISADRPSPQRVGVPVTFTANASGGLGAREYEWWMTRSGYQSLLRAYGPDSTLTWTPDLANASVELMVRVRNPSQPDYANYWGGGSITFAVLPAIPLTLTSLTSNLPSPQAPGAAVTVTATASGGAAPYQYKWWVFDGTWTAVTGWTSASSYVWTPAAAGTHYRVGVWLRIAGSTADAYDNSGANGSLAFTISAAAPPPPPAPSPAGPLTLSALTTSLASPQAVGTAITVTASPSGGTAPYEYKWWIFNGTWTAVTGWTSVGSHVWTPAAAGTNYRIGVWLRNAGSTADAFDNAAANGSVAFTVTGAASPSPAPPPPSPADGTALALTGLTTNVASPQAAGTPITATATGSGGTAPYEYKWWVFNGSWAAVSGWTSSNSYVWTPAAAGAGYRIGVWLRNAGSSADTYANASANGSIGFTVTTAAAAAPPPLPAEPQAGPLTLTALTTNLASPQAAGTAITATAAASGGTAPYEYKWWIFDGSWRAVSGWSASSTYAWTPATAGANYRVGVWLRNAGDTADAYANAYANGSIGFTVTGAAAAPPPPPAAGGPLTLLGLTTSVASPQPVGAIVTVTAAATGGSAPYEYKWWVFDGSWQAVSGWTSSNTYAWTPAAPGRSYRVGVWLRNAGSGADAYDNSAANGSIPFVTSP